MSDSDWQAQDPHAAADAASASTTTAGPREPPLPSTAFEGPGVAEQIASAYESQPSPRRRRRPPVRLPRGLIFLASLWLIGSWLLILGLRPPVQTSSASFTPGVQLMLLSAAIGLMIGWPLLRLSMPSTPRPIAQTILDFLVLLALIQVVMWPLRLVTPWSAWRTAALDATLAGWGALTGAVIASAIGSQRPGPRVLAMMACIGMCLLGPALAWLGVLAGIDAIQLIELSPLMAVRTLTIGGGSPPSHEQWLWIRLLGLAAVLVWVALAVTTAAARRRSLREAAV